MHQWVLYWIYDESKFEYEQIFQIESEGIFENTFGISTMSHISKILLKTNTRVLALVMFYENRKKLKRKCSECWVV